MDVQPVSAGVSLRFPDMQRNMQKGGGRGGM